MVGTGRKGTGTTALVLMDADQTPLGAVITAADEHEVHHIERLVASAVVDLPAETRLVYDKAADCDPLRDRLADQGIELICPHRENRTKPKRPDFGRGGERSPCQQ